MPNRGAAAAVPAPLLFVGSGIFQYTGAGLAVVLFAVVGPAATAWWRLAIGAVFLLVIWRPWRQKWTSQQLLASAIFGLATGGMNILFYEAIARIPLGAAVSIEFLGPVAVAVLRGRGWPPRLAAILALVGIVSIGGWGLDVTDPQARVGALFALAAGALWSAYIVLGQRIASERSGVNSLAVGTAVAALVFAPFYAGTAFSMDFTWQMVLVVLGVGLLSTTVPYSLEALALQRLSPALFALLSALLPATSAIIGVVMLSQIPNPGELLGLCAISVAVWIAVRGEKPTSAEV